MKRYYDKSRSVAFTGHRSLPSCMKEEIKSRVCEQIRVLYAKGYRYFFCGMAIGFDLLAAEEVIKLKAELNELRIIAVVPYKGQNERWSNFAKLKYDRLLQNVDEVEILSETYYNGCFLRRNDFMLSHCSSIIAFFDGKPKGGTFYTIRNAKQMNIAIANVYAK